MARLTRMSGWTGMILAAAGAATPAFAGPEHAEHEHKDSRHANQTIEVITDEGGKRYQIIVHGDEVDARVDGLRISPDRIHREANEIILLDEDGNKIKAITVGPGGQNMRFGFGTDSDLSFVADFERPPVMLGVLLDGPGDALRSQLGVSEYAVLIEKVMEGLPAEKAGLKQWDIIIEVEGEPLDEEGMLHKILMESKPGHELDIVVLRRGAEKKLRIELEAYDAEALGSQDVPFAPAAPGDRGFNWQQDFDLEATHRKLQEMLKNLDMPGGAREKIEQTIRELAARKGDLGALPYRFDNRGRLVRPDNDWREDMTDEFEDRMEDLEEQFEDRLEELEERWEHMEEMFERLFERLDESMERRNRSRDRDD